MRHVRMLGLCLVATIAVAAVAATSASALPEWGQCFVQESHEGKYTDSNCTKKAKTVLKEGKKVPTGEFEFRKGPEVPQKFFRGQGGAGVLEGIFIACPPFTRQPTCPEGKEEVVLGGPVKVECENEENFGDISGTKEVKNVVVKFKGCKLLGTAPCSNAPGEGEIQVNLLKGKLGWINKHANPREVGVLLEPAVKKGEFAKFNCGGTVATVVGMGNAKEGCAYPLPACGGDGIIAPITPVNQMTQQFTQTFTINEETAENIPSKFEGSSPLKVLESYILLQTGESSKWSKAGETITNINEPSEEGEIKAN